MNEDTGQQKLRCTKAGSSNTASEALKQAHTRLKKPTHNLRRFSALLFDLSAQFLSLPANEIGHGIEKGLKLIGEFLNIDRITLTEFPQNGKGLDIVHSYAAPGVSPVLGHFSNGIPWTINEIRKGNTVVLAQLPDDCPEEALQDRQYYLEQGVQSALGLPLRVGKSIPGAIFFDSLPIGRFWPNELVQILDKLGGILTNALERQRAIKQVDELLHFEQLMSEISATYINLPAAGIDSAIEEGLKRIGNFLGADRCSWILFEENENTCRATHSWAVKGVERLPSSIDSKLFPYLTEKWRRLEHVIYRRPEDLPDEASLDKQSALELGARSHFSVPVSVAESVVGVIVLVTVHAHRTWPEDVVQRLCLLGEIFANALTRKRTEQKLRRAFKEINQLKTQIENDNIYLREEIKLEHNFEEIIGQSDQHKYVLFKVEQVAPTDSTVILLGETGTGKELFARAIHNASQRKSRPLIKVNCASLPSSLIESELFGHEKGAFTGATTKRVGRFKHADGATIFLDEIGEVPIELQPKLLRVLQDGEFERLGTDRTLRTDVRIIAATNRDLKKEVKEGRFRQDLWYRLNVFPISVPPLRKRLDDIPMMVNFFVRRFCRKLGKQIDTIPTVTMRALQNYTWPGNVRELEHMIERAVINTRGPVLKLMDKLDSPHEDPGKEQKKPLAEIERDYIVQTLMETKGRVSGPKGAALILGLHPETLRSRMRKLGIQKPFFLRLSPTFTP